MAIRLYEGEFPSNGLERRSKSRVLTLRNQRLGNLFAALSMAQEAEGNRDALAGQKAIVLLVCDGPHLSQDGRGELGAGKDNNCGVARDYAQLLGVAFVEYFVGQSDLCLRRSEVAGHCAQNLQGMCGGQCESDVGRLRA